MSDKFYIGMLLLIVGVQIVPKSQSLGQATVGSGEDLTMADRSRDETYSIVDKRDRIVRGALMELRTRPDPMRKAALIYLLGNLRAAEAVTDLAAELTFVPPEYASDLEREPRWGLLPAQDALISIGSPSLPPLVLVLKRSDDERKRAVAAQTILFVFMQMGDASDARVMSRMLIQRYADREINPVHQQRLHHALRFFPEPNSADTDKASPSASGA